MTSDLLPSEWLLKGVQDHANGCDRQRIILHFNTAHQLNHSDTSTESQTEQLIVIDCI